MRRRIRHLLLLASAGFIAWSPALPMGARADDLSNAQDKQQQLNGNVKNLDRQIQGTQSEEARAQAELNALVPQIATAERNLADQNARLDQLLGSIDDTQRKLATKREELKQRQEILNRRNRAMYKEAGGQTFLDTLFSARNFKDLLNRFIVMRDITHSDQLLVRQLNDDRIAIETLAASLVKQRDQQAAVVAEIASQRAALNLQYARVQALRSQLHLQELSLDEQRAAAQRALSQVNAEIAALVEARKRAHSSGKFAWPGVQGPLTQMFGCTDFAGEPPPPSGYSCPRTRPYFHTGLDIAGPYGAEVDSADGGVAYTYASSGGYGNHIIVVHANGFTTLYGHLSSFAVSSGTPVGKGQRIGYEGSTGFSSGPHLHFEVRLNEAPQDPCRYVGC